MRRLIVAGVILVFICSIAFIGTSYLHRTHQELISLLEQSVQEVRQNNTGKALEYAIAAEELWNKSEPKLSLFISHEDLDPIALCISKIGPYIRNGEDTEFITECETGIVLLLHLYRSSSFSMEIF